MSHAIKKGKKKIILHICDSIPADVVHFQFDEMMSVKIIDERVYCLLKWRH
jgi:hypothetical protein